MDDREDLAWKLYEEDKKRFRTAPFLSTEGGGGVHCFNVPEEKVAGLRSAFTVLFLDPPVMEAIGRDLIDENNDPVQGVKLPVRITMTHVKQPLVCIYVQEDSVDCPVFVHPKSGVWERIEFAVPYKEREL